MYLSSLCCPGTWESLPRSARGHASQYPPVRDTPGETVDFGATLRSLPGAPDTPHAPSLIAVCVPAMSISLAWNDAMSDLDLHVYEPDGQHVYFENMIGVSFTLTRSSFFKHLIAVLP